VEAPKTTPQMIIRTIRTQLQTIETNLGVLEYLINPKPETPPLDETPHGWKQLPPTLDQEHYIKQLGGDPGKVRTRGEADAYIKELRKR